MDICDTAEFLPNDGPDDVCSHGRLQGLSGGCVVDVMGAVPAPTTHLHCGILAGEIGTMCIQCAALKRHSDKSTSRVFHVPTMPQDLVRTFLEGG